MPAQVYSTGSCLIFVGVGDVTTATQETVERYVPVPRGTSGPNGMGDRGDGMAAVMRTTTTLTTRPGDRPIFLGTAEYGPRIHKKPYHRPLKSSASGDAADDVMFMGEEAMVFATLNFWDEDVYRRISSRPFYRAARGAAYDTAPGTLLVREKQTYQLWLQFPYSGKRPGGLDGRLPLQRAGAGAVRRGAAMKGMPDGYHFLEAYLTGPDTLDPLGSRARKIGLAWHCVKERRPRKEGPRLVYDHDMSALVGVAVP